MPFYRLPNGSVYHAKGTKLPPACVAKVGIEPPAQRSCGVMSAFLCDGHVGSGHTCDRALCQAHAHQVGRNRHLCPECLSQQPQRGLFTGVLSEVR